MNQIMLRSLLRENGGEFGSLLFRKVQETVIVCSEDELKPYFERIESIFGKREYEEFDAYLEAAYSCYGEAGYKIGFNDGIRFVVSALLD